jgi:DNA-binding NarL/FixJ family response regulator
MSDREPLRPEALTSARILIVDDQHLNIEALEDLLDGAGYTATRGITDPRQVAGEYTAFSPDLILLDLFMPGLDGFGVMAQLRPLIALGDFLPILVLTGELAPEAKRRALGEGATDFLAKPLDTVEVLLRIHNLLQTRALHLQVQGEKELLEQRVQERTLELQEARADNLELNHMLARRYKELHDLVERLLPKGDNTGKSEQSRPNHLAVERLSGAEQDVLRLVAQGQTNAEIAASRGVSVSTVKTQIESIIGKLGVVDRTQAAVRAVELGMLLPIHEA